MHGRTVTYYLKFKQLTRKILEEPLSIYGSALLLHLLFLALRVASNYNLGYYIVTRRISVYRVIHLNSLFSAALLATSLTLILTAVLSKTGNTMRKALLLVIPLLAPMALLNSKLALTIYLLIALSIGFLLVFNISVIYEGLATGIIILTIASIIELCLATVNIKALELSYLINDLQGLMQPLSPYLYSATLAFSVFAIALNLAKRQRTELNSKGELSGLCKYYYPALGSVLSLMMYTIPYTIIVNPKRMIATTDIVVYVELLEQMREFDSPLVAALALRQGDRFLYMLLLYYLQETFGLDSWTISTFSGWLWTPLLVYSTWYMVRKLYGDEVAKYVALIMPASTQLLGFIYGGFQANQLNLALLYLSMGLLADNKAWKIVLGSITLALSAGVHLWSWMHITPAVILWMFIELIRDRSKENFAKFSLVTAVSSAMLLTAIHIGAFNYIYEGNLIRVLGKTINMSFEAKLNGILRSLSIYIWGSLNNPILFITCIGGQAHRARRPNHTPLDYLNVLTLLGIYLLSPDMTMISRLMLNVPIHVLASIAMENSGKITNTVIYSLLLFNALYLGLNAPPE